MAGVQASLLAVFIQEHEAFVFFFSSRRRHTRFDCDWSSDVCSSDLSTQQIGHPIAPLGPVSLFVNHQGLADDIAHFHTRIERSEERRVGKERRSRWSPYRYNNADAKLLVGVPKDITGTCCR